MHGSGILGHGWNGHQQDAGNRQRHRKASQEQARSLQQRHGKAPRLRTGGTLPKRIVAEMTALSICDAAWWWVFFAPDTWASRGETLVSTLAAQTTLRLSCRRAAARPMCL